ncbi:tRNA (adenosine(37)-N6)-threonylcarbamoyltransferase complex ATPase subunit type 1 TsaE [Thermoactinomyces mirandus]|uniref:tRNA threonylcarbamoyladenosine biosynthesis protein TsaE n=1 Tax=Thermoactinomyces mirandus TaxID=2756294 RepID=A0A7W1XV55_9BACL|nr:tRNA (adenosine(37)-N6)-threonylcarbamoyltransferase complex ATPase subunit type 1 TsaE [Thermoactinomyces mirandus]MBA4603565.1 tRNA (adenosine(37)-N6)-threonylcarbamoyltransferase complex ATPase subunit type 1 TsaE [Thermoactinomyces mirandus]
MKTNHIVHTHDEEETRQLARKIASHLKPGDVLALEGDLGAGKTTFTKGIAEGLGISDSIDSPTFTIIKEYEGDLPLFHMDMYRIDFPEEELGLEEYFYGDGVCLVEWASHIKPWLPETTLWLVFSVQPDQSRQIGISYTDPRWNLLGKELASE